MTLFDNKKPFFIKIYSSEKDSNFQKDFDEIYSSEMKMQQGASERRVYKREAHTQAKSNDAASSFPMSIPVFQTPPVNPIAYTFGLCIYNLKDIQVAQDVFRQNASSGEPSKSNFLYIMGDACRQTDTLELASQTGYPLIIEKGPFLSPNDIKRMVAKLTHKNFAIVECGSSFGYADRILDPRSLFSLKEVSAYFGICISDLLAPQDEVYAHRAEWLSDEKFIQAFDLTAKSFEPNFYVYKMAPKVNPRDENVRLVSSKTFAGGWDGCITSNVTLNRNKLTVIAGPCMLETLEIGLEVGRFMKNLCQKLGYQYIFKSSFDKANRTSGNNARGPGLDQGIKWLEQIKQELNVPILTDVHSAEQAQKLEHVVDVLQIPAFLFREKKLLLACAQTGKVLQIKKGQWASAQDMLNVASFLAENNFHKVILAERGSCFGYNNLVVDFRNLIDMAEHKNAVVFDATHSVQLPGAKNGKSSGLRHMVPALTRAAIAVGVDGLFMEVHPNPALALSDADTQLSFEMVREILESFL